MSVSALNVMSGKEALEKAIAEKEAQKLELPGKTGNRLNTKRYGPKCDAALHECKKHSSRDAVRLWWRGSLITNSLGWAEAGTLCVYSITRVLLWDGV